MVLTLPVRLLCHNNGKFSVIDPQTHPGGVASFDIVSYRWGEEVDPYPCDIHGVTWNIKISQDKLNDLKRLMIANESTMQYLWADCVCIDQGNEQEKSIEIAKMYEYYRQARKCHILIDMEEVWKPSDIVDNLKFLNDILLYMGGATLASEARLTENLTSQLARWERDKPWSFAHDATAVRSAAVEPGILNCYATSVAHVRDLFKNLYFSRVWTFQEMLLGRNITMWGINADIIAEIGQFETWIDLAIDVTDKAQKLKDYIKESRYLSNRAANTILRIIEEDKMSLGYLQIQVQGISSARTDIINGGPRWWFQNYKGISNVFSAVSLRPRECKMKADVFRGLLGVFSGLFTPDQIQAQMSGTNIDAISFAFFKQLSLETGYAWTRLAISSSKRDEWNWIPVTPTPPGATMTTDCFAGVLRIGRLRENGRVEALATVGLEGVPRQYMSIAIVRQGTEGTGLQFRFRGCNCGKKVKTGTFSSEHISVNDHPKQVTWEETGRTLVECATLLGSIMDPAGGVVEYRKRLLHEMQPQWNVDDPSAKPAGWVDRCVSGTWWEKADGIRIHNRSVHYDMPGVTGCESRLDNKSTAGVMCEVRVSCGCFLVAPFWLVMGGLTAVEGSFLGDITARLDDDNRIVLTDGLGLVQVGDVGKTFQLVAFGGEPNAYKSHASDCRGIRRGKPVVPKQPWPTGRALVREEFHHGIAHGIRDYGYLDTEGSGNLLICRNNPVDQYKIIGVCIDQHIASKKGSKMVVIK